MEFLREKFAGAEEMTLHVAEWDVQFGCNFIVRHFLIMPEFDDDAIIGRQ
jgi:hypothetical protein